MKYQTSSSSSSKLVQFFLFSLLFLLPGNRRFDLGFLQEVLGDLPQKTFTDQTVAIERMPLQLPTCATGKESYVHWLVSEALDRVLRLLQVGSKRFLTNKVLTLLCLVSRHTPSVVVGKGEAEEEEG